MTPNQSVAFRRFGRSLHPVIRNTKDLRAVVELDEAHWVATAAPTEGLHADEVFLRWIDADDNGRVMCWEIRDAAQWLTDVLADHSGIDGAKTSLTLGAINGESADGRQIRAAAQKMLRRLGQNTDDDKPLTLEQVRQIRAQAEASSVSEAGVVLPEAAEDSDIRQYLTDIITAVGGSPHPSGKDGVDSNTLAAFAAESAAYLDWLERGAEPADGQTNDVYPLGAKTAEAFATFQSLRAKLDQYFAQCHAVALDESLVGRMGWTAGELEALDLDDVGAIDRLLDEAPIARARPDLELAFDEAINPHDADALDTFAANVIPAVLGKASASLTARQWEQIKDFFAARDAWTAAKPTSNITRLDPERLAAYQQAKYADLVRKLIAESEQTAFHLDNVRLVEKVLLYQAGLLELANNFIAFPHLYDPTKRAMFEMGSVIMDGRRFEFAVKVINRAAHAAIADSANMYLMYIEVAPRAGEGPLELAVPVTSGNKGNLCLGKRGIFCDRLGYEHDARVVHVLENPISLSEAMVAPFVRLGRMLTGKIESITSKAEQQFDQRAESTMTVATEQPAAPPKSSMANAGMLAGAGVAIAAVGSALAYMTEKLTKLHWYEIWIGIGAAVLAVLIPTMVVAVLKLRKRDLSAVLEGSGWAVNARMRLTHRLGRVFTRRPCRPLGARLIGKRRIRTVVVIVLVTAALAGGGWFAYDRWFVNDETPAGPTSQPTSAPASR